MKRMIAAALLAVVSLPGAESAGAESLWTSRNLGGEGAVILVGHDNVDVPAAVPRFSGTVVEVGAPNSEGRVASFKTSFDDLAINEVRSWRLTILSGELLGMPFVVKENDADEIMIVDDENTLAGLAPGDLFVLEEIFTRRIIRIQ